MQFGCDKISSNFEFNQQKCNCNVDVDVDVDVVVKQAQVQVINYFFARSMLVLGLHMCLLPYSNS